MTAYTKEMIFGNQKKRNIEEKKDENLVTIKDEITQLPIDKLINYREYQPFSVHREEKILQLQESIERNGILSPIIVRKIESDLYEILAGRHRVMCAKNLSYTTVPAIIKDVNDTNARLIMLETNLCQPDDIPPVEKGYAYKMHLETLKEMRNEETVPWGQGYSIDKLAENVNESQTNIKRLIRLTELIKPLQDKVNSENERLPIKAGVELSYLSDEEQNIINKVIDENNIKLKVEQAKQLRSMEKNINETNVIELFTSKPKENINKFTGKVKKETIKKYKNYFKTNDEFNNLIEDLLEKYFKNSA